MRRFVLHKHSDYGPTHWDLMLETGDGLATWRVSVDLLGELPDGERVDAIRIHDHRKAYLDYSGPVSGDRGRVDLQDSGSLSVLSESDDLWTFELRGSALGGKFELRRVSEESGAWILQRVVDR